MRGHRGSRPGGQPQGQRLLALYDRALPEVYGYLVHRCDSPALAEDLTSETFLAAVDAVRRDRVPDLSVAWLVGVARHKLADHWRGQARDERRLQAVAAAERPPEDAWDAAVDAMDARTVLAGMAAQHRAALTLRYVDGLPVSEVAEHVGRTVHATEALLVRARAAFRKASDEQGGRHA